MKKLAFLSAILFITVTLNGFAQQADVSSCSNAYKGQVTKGYNALAMAIDNGFFVCGFAFGHPTKEGAAKQALSECERNRLNPANEVKGMRKIMTHCRIHEFKLME